MGEKDGLVCGRDLDQRLEEVTTYLHQPSSGALVGLYFPDGENVFEDEHEDILGHEGNPLESDRRILPFTYWYSKEADRTFCVCNVNETVFIYDGRLDKPITFDDFESGKAIVTPRYIGLLRLFRNVGGDN